MVYIIKMGENVMGYIDDVRRIREPYLYSSNGIITEVNNEFIIFTGFTMGELMGKSLVEISKMIKFNLELNLNSANTRYSGFMFTKFMEAREVEISLSFDNEKNKQKYIFVEKSNSRVEDKFTFIEQMCTENISSVAIYSGSDLKLLKANKAYLNLMNPPFNIYENIIGRSIEEIINGYKKIKIDAIWESLCQRKKTVYIKQLKLKNANDRIRYWDFTVIPIVKNNEIKYIVVTSIEVTEIVLKNRRIERQKKIIEKQKEELEEKNSQLKTIFENLSEGVMLSDKKDKIIMINKEGKRLIYKNDKFAYLNKAHKHIKFFDIDGNEMAFDEMPRARALKGEIVKNVKMMVRRYGKEYFVDSSSIPVYDENGDLNMVISCFHDITETILQSKKIEEQKSELHAIIENITEGIYILDDKGKYKLFNKAAREIFFNDNEYYVENEPEIYGDNGEKINTENYPSQRVIKGEKFKNMGLSLKFSDRTLKIDVSGTPIYNKKGEFLLGVFCCRDMTNYYKQEEMLRTRNEFLNRLIYNLELPVIGLDSKELRVVKMNQKAFNNIKIYRPDIKSAAKMKGNKITDIISNFGESDYCQKINEVIKEKRTKYLNKKKSFVNGSEVYSNLIFEPIFEVNEELKEILILIIDVTSEVKSNIVMEKTLKSQEEFLANISHELKTPLNVIFATAQLLNMYCMSSSLEEKKDFIIKYIDSIKQNSYRLSKLINNIVDLSKIEAGFFELKLLNKNIVEVVEEIVVSVTNFTEFKGINIIFDTDTEEKIIACDPEKIERIVLNLISNAIKFSNEGDQIFVKVKDNHESVEISVKDNGIGIESRDLKKIFDRFKQVDKSLSRNSEGTGIGLSLVKSFVELHGGSIKVESKIGRGSKFIVILPSRSVLEENMLIKSNIRNKNESIQVEFSDVYS